MNQDDTLYKKWICLNYHILGTLDEYSIAKINVFGNVCFMLLNSSIVISMILTAITGQTEWQLIPVLSFFGIQMAKYQFIKKSGTKHLEVSPEDFKQARLYLTKRAALLAIIQFIVLFSLGIYLLGFEAKSIHYPDCSFYQMVAGIGAISLIVTIILFIANRQKYLSHIVIIEETK